MMTGASVSRSARRSMDGAAARSLHRRAPTAGTGPRVETARRGEPGRPDRWSAPVQVVAGQSLALQSAVMKLQELPGQYGLWPERFVMRWACRITEANEDTGDTEKVPKHPWSQ